jgi:hypothetical protein
MEDYLDKLERMIQSKNIEQFCVFPDVKPFKIIKKDKAEIKKVLKENPEKYSGRKVAIVTLKTDPKGFKKNDDIFSIGIGIYMIYEDGSFNKRQADSWGLLLKYMPEDLEKYPFSIKNLEKIVNLVYKGKIASEFGGMYYDHFKKLLKKMSDKKSKKISRIKSKKSIKSSLKKYKKKSLKRTRKSSKKY